MEEFRMHGGRPLPPDAPRFQAYLKQQLLAEHRHLRLDQSRRNWRITALAAMALLALSVARPMAPQSARERLRTLFGSTPAPRAEPAAGTAESVPLAAALEASLAQDGALARELGALRTDGVLRPDQAFVVSRFSISGGRAVSIYTPLTASRQDQEGGFRYASNGGVW